MSDIKILHISDIHIKNDNYRQDRVLSAFLSSLPKLIERFGRIDLVFLTGDIAYSGEAPQYEAGSRFLDEILQLTALARNQLYVVPGNHDIHRPSGKALARTLGQLYT